MSLNEWEHLIINVLKSGSGAVFDSMNGYTWFRLTLADTANTVGGTTVNFDCSCDC